VGERNVEANRVALERATENAKRLSITRRRFLVSSAGAASTLLAFNDVNAAAGKLGAPRSGLSRTSFWTAIPT
jgi:hypothetical protein